MSCNIFSFWYVDRDLGVFVPMTRERKLIVPVLEFSKIGEDGNFNKPFTHSLEYMESRHLGNLTRVSRNYVPKPIKDYFREFYRSKEKKREGVRQDEVGLAPKKEG